jgi:TPR repeat protein
LSDESQLQVRPKDSDSSLRLSRVSSGLIARGLRDAEAIARQVDPLSETRRLAEEGHAYAQFNLGLAYYHGQGVPQDYVEAVKWYRKAAEQGNAMAQYNLGNAYYYGRVPQDYVEAAKWYRKAAEQGNATAQYDLGYVYCHGQGVPQDYVQAHMWMDLAASASTGDDQNKYSSGRDAVAAKMTPQQLAEAQRLAREWRPKTR